MIMTFQEYDALVESYKDKKTLTYWPEVECIPLLESDPEKWIPTVIYLTEYGKTPRTEREKHSKKMLNRFLRKHLELIDDEEDDG